MSDDSDSWREQVGTPGGLSRRALLRGAGATAAGAVVLGDSLLNVARADPQRNKGHTKAKRHTCLAPVTDGAVLASDDEGGLSFWTVGNDIVTKTAPSVAPHKGKATFVAFCGNTKQAFTAGYDGKVIVHNGTKVTEPALPEITTFTRHGAGIKKREVWVVAVSAEGNQAVSASNDGKILLWDPSKGDDQNVKEFGDNDDPVGGLAFVPTPGPNGEARFISTHPHGDVNLWNTNLTKRPDHKFSHKNSHPVNAVAVAGDGSFFITGSFDTTLRMWRLTNLEPQPLKTLKGHKGWVWRVAISPNNQLAASAGEDGWVRVWDLLDPQPVIQPIRNFGPFTDGSMAVAFLTNNRIVYAARALDDPQPLEVQTLFQ